MSKRILIVGSGFAGMWSALAAARLLEQAGTKGQGIELSLVAPEPRLVIRPRLYEADAGSMAAPLGELFDAVGVRYVRGTVDRIRAEADAVEVVAPGGARSVIQYDRLVLASGSQLHRPDLPGLRQHAFSVDQLDEAAALEAHCKKLASLPWSKARNTVAIVGGGFTGIELAAEMPARLRDIFGAAAEVRVVVVELAESIGPELGPGPRPVIERALAGLGVEYRLGTGVSSIDERGLVTSAGERIEALTVVWTAGMRASPLTQQIAGERDRLGRLHVDAHLRVAAAPRVFATGDTAFAATDELGNHALMSCQHAMSLGRSAGHNAAADLLGGGHLPYTQPKYVTCLDLGPWGAVLTDGWSRKVKQSGAEVKPLKRFINSQYIYPPKPDRAAALAAADPAQVVDV